MEYKDYYKILGVSRNASEQEIKSAYRKLARTYHPDVNPNNKEAEAQFKDINEAYQVLSDKSRREKYDRFGQDWQHYQHAGAGHPGGYSWGGVGGGGPRQGQGFSDFFESLFGAMGGAPGGVRYSTSYGSGYPGGGVGFDPGGMGGMPAQEAEHPVEISLEEAFHGTQRRMQVSKPDGTQHSITVKIPPGVDTNKRIRIAGEGISKGSHRAGDIYLVVRVLPNNRFEREGNDLKTKVKVDLYTLLLGGEARIPTIDGKTLTLTIPPDTPNGEVFRLNGQGMPHLNDTTKRGALYATIEAALPTKLSPRERELFEELRTLRA